MSGLLFWIGACAVAILIGSAATRAFSTKLDPAERLGVSGALGLGAIGWYSFFVGLFPFGFSSIALIIPALYATFVLLRGGGCAITFRPIRGYSLLGIVALTVLGLSALVGCLAPADPIEWDSLAYHLAVPKIWLAAGSLVDIPTIHHSHFPGVVDNLFLYGLKIGGEIGAKLFNLSFFIFGILFVFGYARRRFSPSAGIWSALAFATMPVILWESGTAYIDAANAVFAAIGILYALEAIRLQDNSWLLLSGGGLGLAAASKYTGLQTALVVLIVLALCLVKQKRFRPAMPTLGFAALIAIVICAPWYVRNVVTTGNPVYPFFYSIFGGKGWDTWRAEIYADEQQTFGIGRNGSKRDPAAFAPAVLGVAYQPGRYVNPGQTQGQGFPVGAIGIVPIVALLTIFSKGRNNSKEGPLLAITLLALLIWFFLSQQSRYAAAIFVPICAVSGGVVARAGPGLAVAVAITIQALYSGWMQYVTTTQRQLPVVLGRVTADEYRAQSSTFFDASRAINQLPVSSKVALYDVVFGFWLDLPYLWANPGHSTLLDYDSCNTGTDFANELKKNAITHVYVDLSTLPREQNLQWLSAMGIAEGGSWSTDEREALLADKQTRWRVLLADAVRNNNLERIGIFRGGILLAIR